MFKKERNNNLTSKKTLRKIKKQVKGITLIALVVTIIVLLILAGVALNLTIGENGLFTRAQNAANIWQLAEQNEQNAMNNLASWMDSVTGGNLTALTEIDGVPIPDGFYYAGGSKSTGLVISDNPDDKKEFSEETKTETVSSSLQGNQFVWVPVANPNNLFTEETVQLNGVKTTTSIYSNLTIRDEEKEYFTSTKPGTLSHTLADEGKVREPDVLGYYDTESQYYNNILKFNSTESMAESFVTDYKHMSDSIKKHNGFYIGRYELTGSVESPTEKLGKVLTADYAESWYNLYKACQNVVQGKENVKSTMIYGVQWDAVCNWLKQSGYNTDTDSSSWGNYDESGSKIDTGSNTSYQVKGIFDLAGNYLEWTQEASMDDLRVVRGGSYLDRFGISSFNAWRFKTYKL